MTVKPILQALILADQIYVDVRTGKKVIAGTFNQLYSNRFPNQLGRITYAFFCLTEIVGKVELTLRWVDLRDNKVLMQTEPFTVKSNDRLVSVESILEVPPFVMPHPGFFAFELVMKDELIGALRIQVAALEEK